MPNPVDHLSSSTYSKISAPPNILALDLVVSDPDVLYRNTPSVRTDPVDSAPWSHKGGMHQYSSGVHQYNSGMKTAGMHQYSSGMAAAGMHQDNKC